ncbi:hypothetical protein ACWDQ0_04165 [Streptomyces sp. NPDC003642]
MDGIDVVNGVVGAALGMVFAVLFQQPLQDAWFRLRRRSTSALRSLGRGDESAPAWRAFSLGPLQTSALIVEGDGELPISPDTVHVHVLDEEVTLPPDMAGWRDEIAAESEQVRADGRTPLWNGPRYAVESLDISRTALEERPEVHLRLRPTDYYTFLAAQQLDRRLPDGTTPRSRYLDPDEPLKAPAFLQCSLGSTSRWSGTLPGGRRVHARPAGLRAGRGEEGVERPLPRQAARGAEHGSADPDEQGCGRPLGAPDDRLRPLPPRDGRPVPAA